MPELLTTDEMAQADSLASAAGCPGIDLMEAAGAAVADVALSAMPGPFRVTVVCGPGNNGGDGFVAARILANRGCRVRVALLGEATNLRGDAAEAARRWPGPIVSAAPPVLVNADLIVDAMFGAGLSRPLDNVARDLVEAMNVSAASILAVDLPSGINGDTGAVMGAAVRATRTVSFFRRKPGHLLLPGRVHCGPVTVADIGIPSAVLDSIKPRRIVNAPRLWEGRFPVPRTDGHKYARGHAVVVSGGASTTGAARLAARGALRAGAGLVTIASPRDALAINAAGNLAIMVRAVEGASEFSGMLEDRRINALVVGPGGGVGEPMRAMVAAALAHPERRSVLDADALTSFAGRPGDLAALLRGPGEPRAVLTPHQGEFTRLFGHVPYIAGMAAKSDAASAAARHVGAVVVLKGADTVIAAPDGRIAISENAPPWLATAGAGDVLAGMIAGLLAQGMPSFEAAAAGVWLHAEAGNHAGPGLIADDLPEMLARVYQALFEKLAVRMRRGLQ